MKEMKLNAVKNLMQSLEFNRKDKEALLQYLQQELGVQGDEVQSQPSSQPYGSRLLMEVLYEDGTTGWYQDKSKKIIGIIVLCVNRKFALYTPTHNCTNHSSLTMAQYYAKSMPKINGRSWRVLTVSDCRAIRDKFRMVNQTLGQVGWRKIISSNRFGVLTSDESMAGATDWQVWFALDL